MDLSGEYICTSPDVNKESNCVSSSVDVWARKKQIDLQCKAACADIDGQAKGAATNQKKQNKRMMGG